MILTTTLIKLLRTSAFFLLVAALSACGQLDRFGNKEAVSEQAPTTLPVVTAEPVLDNNSPQTLVNETAEVPVDLLSRIRNGFELPPLESKHIESYEKWNTRHPTFLKNLFERAEPFLFYIVEEVEKRGMPMEIALLPAVESAFKPRARSRSRAEGLWQFIPSTGRHFKLRQDWWYDGRLDFIASTDAALDYLQQLHKRFNNDWYLALAAYNGGQGTVSRAQKYNAKKGKPTHYQALKLRAETRKYVPKLFAFRNIIADPARFGVTLPIIENKPHFEVVSLAGQTDIYQFSKQANIDLDQLKHLNAGHKRWASSPDGPHRLLIPIDKLAASKAVLTQMAALPSVKFRDHRIAGGETLSAIARRYQVSVSALRQTNNLASTSIREGKTLLIPIPSSGNNQPISGSYGSAAQESDNGDSGLMHHVVQGDTLWSIARRYRVKVAQLANWNRLGVNQVLALDQVLTVFPSAN